MTLMKKITIMEMTMMVMSMGGSVSLAAVCTRKSARQRRLSRQVQ